MKLLGVEEVMALLGVKSTKAYDIIRQLNAELLAKGYVVIRGKIPEKYLMERIFPM